MHFGTTLYYLSLLDNGIYQCDFINHRVWGDLDFDLLKLESKVKLVEVGVGTSYSSTVNSLVYTFSCCGLESSISQCPYTYSHELRGTA